ncbi:MAG: hypothetical protein JW725_00030 [Candidatus Babeliaceae bacterium]|nr:hypothetical protein [Candidatus Babeliaceae bacterium]
MIRNPLSIFKARLRYLQSRVPSKIWLYISSFGLILGCCLIPGGIWYEIFKPIIFNEAGYYRIPGISEFLLFVSTLLLFGWFYGSVILVVSIIGLIYSLRPMLSKWSFSFHYHDGILAIVSGCFSACCGPLAYYLVMYCAGWGLFPDGVGLLFFLFGSGVSLIIFLFLRQIIRTTSKQQVLYTIVISIIILISYQFLVLKFLPPGGIIWTNGFVASISRRVNLDELQTWAVEKLSEYRNGTLKTVGESEYWALAEKELDPQILPGYLQHIRVTPPSVGIVTPDHSTVGDYCIAISWYLFGILVGEPDFQSQWDPWYIREIKPGIVVYYIEK